MNNEETNTNDNPKNQSQADQPFGAKKVFDVVRPGKAPASPTSRPVITGHKPQVKDDQFVPSADSRMASDNPFDKHDLMSHKGGVHFDDLDEVDDTTADEAKDSKAEEPSTAPEPVASAPDIPEVPAADVAEPAAVTPLDEVAKQLSQGVDEDEPEPAVQQEAANDAAPELPEQESKPADPETKPAETPEPAKAPETPAEPAAPEDKPDEPVAPEAEGPTPSEDDKPTTEALTSKATLGDSGLPQLGPDDVVAATGAPMIDHAFVVHHKEKTKWWEWLVILLLIIAIAAVALNFLLDAGVINTSLNIPHTNLIK